MEQAHEIAVKHTVAHAQVNVKTGDGIPPEIETVVQLVVKEPGLIRFLVPDQLQVLDIAGEGPVAGGGILSIGEAG